MLDSQSALENVLGVAVIVQDWSLQCPSNTIWPFKYTSLKTTLHKSQPLIENEDITWSPKYNLPTTRSNKRTALSLQEVESDGWFSILHIVLKTCSILFMHKFNMSFVFHFYILGLMSWIWTNPSTEELKFQSPSKWNSYEGLQLWTLTTIHPQGHFTYNIFQPLVWSELQQPPQFQPMRALRLQWSSKNIMDKKFTWSPT